ncbi:efflux RND transporter periplasmic adaptor subunit [Xanthobacteraceae bacterium A53D]
MLLLAVFPLAVAPAQAQAPLPAVGVAEVALEDVAPASEFIGRVEALNAVDIRARVEGFIEARPFAEGQAVTAGEDLFLIEKAPYEAALVAAQARLAAAAAALRDAEGRLARNLELRRSATVSQATLDEVQAGRDTAAANVLAAEAGVRQAELNLGYTRIQSPIAGRIGTAAFAVGSLVGPSSGPLARVVQVDPIRVVFSVSDRAILDLRGAEGGASKEDLAARFTPTLRLSNGTAFPASGQIAFAGNELDPRTGTLPVRAVFPNPDGVLVPGQFVTVLIRTTAPRRLPVVPLGAVQLDRDGRFVLLADAGDTAVVRRIRTGRQIGQTYAVEEGLSGGERLIVEGLQHVRPGAKLRVMPASGMGGAAR